MIPMRWETKALSAPGCFCSPAGESLQAASQEGGSQRELSFEDVGGNLEECGVEHQNAELHGEGAPEISRGSPMGLQLSTEQCTPVRKLLRVGERTALKDSREQSPVPHQPERNTLSCRGIKWRMDIND